MRTLMVLTVCVLLAVAVAGVDFHNLMLTGWTLLIAGLIGMRIQGKRKR